MSTPDDPRPRQKLEQEERQTPDVMPMHRPIMREMAEPKDGFEPTPVWLVLIYFALIGWGGYYLAFNSGAFRSDIFTDGPRQTMSVGGADVSAPKPVDPMVLGKRVYNNCTSCHQTNGQGVAGVYPPLAGSEYVTGAPEVLANILLQGINGPLTVMGKSYNGEMPNWKKLKDEQLAAVMTYIRNTWGNSAPPVDAELVSSVRESTSGRGGTLSEADLRQLIADYALK